MGETVRQGFVPVPEGGAGDQRQQQEQGKFQSDHGRSIQRLRLP